MRRAFVTMRFIEENIPHPEQRREWPDEAAATMAYEPTVPIPLGKAYEMRAAVAASLISGGLFLWG